MQNGRIILIPTTLGSEDWKSTIPADTVPIICSLKYFIVENIRTARRYLKKLDRSIAIDELTFFELNKHTNLSEIEKYLTPCRSGFDVGVISEAGCPGVADPGADIVAIAHKQNIRVLPLVGPSSILMALMASGFNGQSFAFNGYLPIKAERVKKLQQMEQLSQRLGQSQIFMEAPYRNQKLLEDILQHCSGATMLCIACDITLESEYIVTKSVNDWKKQVPQINKRPTMFVMHKY